MARFTSEELAKITINLRKDQMQWIESRIKTEGLSITNFIRAAVDKAIREKDGIRGGQYGTESFAVSTPTPSAD